MSITYIKQKHPSGCVIASLAMVTGQTYDKVLSDLKGHWHISGASSGVDDDASFQYLSKLGYAIRIIPHDYAPTETFTEEWPPKPFAPIHICSVFNEGFHAVVMDDKGKIYDPDDKKKKKLSDFHRVYNVVGIYKVNENNTLDK
jgi:hypothetical protein